MDSKLTVFIIHLERETSRLPHIQKIKERFKNVIVFPAIDKNTLDWNYWKSLKHFHRLPTHQNKEIILGEVALSLTNLKLLQHIVDEKLDNVLILEDDVILNPSITQPKTLTFNDTSLYYLGGHLWNKKIWGTFAILYPTWKFTNKALEILKDPKKFRAWDSMIVNYINKKFPPSGYWDHRHIRQPLESLVWTQSLLIPDLNLSSILRNKC